MIALVPVGGTSLPPVPVLVGNFPNPFNPVVRIPFALPDGSPVRVRVGVWNALGQRIRRLTDEPLVAGYHEVTWDARDDAGRPVASGVYFCRLEADETVTARLVLTD